jgi:protein tyrosine phosphatase
MVKLHTTSKNPLDSYINANYIRNPYTGSSVEIIATQAPKPETFFNFWTMIWQEMVSIVVMLCGLEENGRVSCHVYWPEETKTITFGNLTLTGGEVDKSNDFFWTRQILIKVVSD